MRLQEKKMRRTPAEWLLAGEALMLLAVFRVWLRVSPVRSIIARITRHNGKAQAAGSSTPAEAARRVRWAVSAAARYSPAEFVCFPQALAGYTMLRWWRVPSTIVYGVRRSAEGDLMAHAWLTVGDTTVLGGEAAPDFTPVERWS